MVVVMSPFLDRIARIEARRFSGESMTGFGPEDSLVRKIERIWNLKPGSIEISIGYVDPNDADILCWTRVQMSRGEAARTLRGARRRLLTIEKSRNGWSISGEINPAWEYA
jgi:hypothetical protein